MRPFPGFACGLGLGLLLLIPLPISAQAPTAAPLTPEQVASSWNAVRQFGCRVAGYLPALRDGDDKIKARGGLGGTDVPVGLSDGMIGRVYSLRFPERTGDADLARLAPHLKRLPFLAALDLGSCPIGDAGLKHLRELTELEALLLDGTR